MDDQRTIRKRLILALPQLQIKFLKAQFGTRTKHLRLKQHVLEGCILKAAEQADSTASFNARQLRTDLRCRGQKYLDLMRLFFSVSDIYDRRSGSTKQYELLPHVRKAVRQALGSTPEPLSGSELPSPKTKKAPPEASAYGFSVEAPLPLLEVGSLSSTTTPTKERVVSLKL